MPNISISSSDLFTLAEFFHLNADEWIEEGREDDDPKTYARLSALIGKLHEFFEGETGKILVENKDIPNPFWTWLEKEIARLEKEAGYEAAQQCGYYKIVFKHLREIAG